MTEGKKRRVKAVVRDHQSANEGATGEVPGLLGASVPNAEPTVSRGGGLPGVQVEDSHKETLKVPQSTQSLGKRVVSYSACSLEQRISLLNAYRRIASKAPKLSGFDATTQDIISAEYAKWIANQMALVFAAADSSDPFTPDETQALRLLARKILTQASASKQTPTTMTTTTSNETPKASATAVVKPKVEKKLTKSQLEFIAKLERMDREGPQF